MAAEAAKDWIFKRFVMLIIQARNQDFMRGGANEAKVNQTTEMYFLLPDPFIQENSNSWEIATPLQFTKCTVGAEYCICRIQLF